MTSDADTDPRSRLGDHVALQRGTTYKSALLGLPGPMLLGLASIERNGGFRAENLRSYGGESPEKLILRPGDMYVSLKDVTQSGDLLGAVARVPETVPAGRLTQDTVALKVMDARGPASYLYWLLRTPEFRAYCRAHAMGTTNLSLSRADFLALPVPPLTESRLALVELLESLTRKIDSNRRLAALLEQITQHEFQSRFVDSLHAAGMDDGAGQPPPPGWWGSGTVAEIAELHRESTREELPYIGLSDMPRGSTILDNWVTAGAPSGESSRFEVGDILFGKLRPYFKKVGVAPIAGRCSTEILVLRPRRPELFGPLLGHVASQRFIDHCIAVSRGTRMPRAEWRDAGQLRIAVPPDDVAAEFTEMSHAIYAQIRGLTLESRTLAAVRDALLPKLVSGQIRVPDTADPEEVVGPAAEELVA